MDLGSILAAGVGFVVGFFVEAKEAGEDIIGEGFDLQVVPVDGVVEFPTGDTDTILGTGNVGLKVLELLGGTQFGISFGDGHQAGKRVLQTGLCALILAKGSGVVN